MKLVKKLKLKINSSCKEYLDFASEKCRLVYNFALSDKIKAYQDRKENLSLYDLKKTFNSVTKEQYPEYKKVYNKCLSAMFFRLDKAYKRFFRLNKGFPNFKRKNEFVSQEYPGMYIKKLDDYRFTLPSGKGIDNFIVRTFEKIPERYDTVTITKKDSHYFACFIVEESDTEFVDNGSVLAVDLGVKKLVTAINTDGELVEVDKFSHWVKHIDNLQSKRDHHTKHSRRWEYWNKIWKRQLDRYVRRVNDYMHKASYWLVHRKESTIVVGDLNLEGMKTNQSWSNRIIQNNWRVGRFVDMLAYKTVKFGKRQVNINERGTTRTCSRCGNSQEMSLSDRTYHCSSCGLVINRDVNSAFNILKKYCVAHTIDFIDIFSQENNLSNEANSTKFVYV